MIRAIALACCLALPASAQDMTPEICRDSWHAFNDMTGQSQGLIKVQPNVTADGWCRVDSTNAQLQANDFASLEFRGAGLGDAVINQGAPETLEVRIDGIDLIKGWKLPLPAQYAGPRGTAKLSYSYDPRTKDMTLKALGAEFGGLGHIKINGQGSGVDLSLLNAMQITSGGARLHDLTLQLQATPLLKEALLPSLAAAMGDIFLQAIPDTSIDGPSRDALRQFLASGPGTDGLLRVSAKSEAGMGFLQIMGGVMSLRDQGISPDNLGNSLEILLNGVILSAEWTSI